MREKLENLIEQLEKKQKVSLMCSEAAIQDYVKEKWKYKANAFSESAQLITDILNSENPNSVSNQPETVKH